MSLNPSVGTCTVSDTYTLISSQHPPFHAQSVVHLLQEARIPGKVVVIPCVRHHCMVARELKHLQGELTTLDWQARAP